MSTKKHYITVCVSADIKRLMAKMKKTRNISFQKQCIEALTEYFDSGVDLLIDKKTKKKKK